MTNKKAISDLVATVLLILVTIAAVGIIAGAVMPIIRTNIEKSQKCFDAGLELPQSGITCYDAFNNQLDVQVSKNEKSSDMTNLQIQVNYQGTSKSFKITNSTIVLGNAGVIPNPNEKIKYSINTTALNLAGVDTVSVAAMLKIGNTEQLCSSTPELAVESCG